MTTKVLGIFIGIVLFAISGTAAPGIGEVRWELTELNGESVRDSTAFIEFNESENRIAGNTGCNRMFGSYELADGMFKLKGAGSTRMACLQDGAMETEAALLRALGEADSLKQRGQTLAFHSNGKRVLKFKAAKSGSTSTDLTSKKWILKKIGDMNVDLGSDVPFLNFDAEKKGAGGNSGCNVFGGNYETEGKSIKFRDIISTMRACEFEDRMTIERGFLDGLQNADRFEIKGGKLFLYRENKVLLEFEGISK